MLLGRLARPLDIGCPAVEEVTEAALEQCERTMTQGADVTPDGIKKLVDAFAELGVTGPQIEARIQRRLDAVRPAQIVMLRKIYTSLRDGMSEVADWFDAVVAPLAEPPTETAPARSRGRPRKAESGGGDKGGGGDKPPETPPPSAEPQPQGDATQRVRFE